MGVASPLNHVGAMDQQNPRRLEAQHRTLQFRSVGELRHTFCYFQDLYFVLTDLQIFGLKAGKTLRISLSTFTAEFRLSLIITSFTSI